MKSNDTEIIIYQSEDGVTKIDVRMEDETVWLSLDQMAELFTQSHTLEKEIKERLGAIGYEI